MLKVGDWVVERELNAISGGGRDVRLEPKIMEVLLFLAGDPGSVVSKERLMAAVWRDTFVTEQVLTNAIWELRKALGDDARSPRYIQTVPKSGYRFIAQVSTTCEVTNAAAQPVGEQATLPAGEPRPAEGKALPLKWRVTVGLAAALVGLAALLVWRAGLPPRPTNLPSGVTHREVREAYAKGLERFHLRTPTALRESLGYFEEAISLDPNYAPAHAALAANYLHLVPKTLAPHDGYPKARAAALKALELDPRLPEAHSSMAMIRLVFDRDWAGAERGFRQALGLAPRNAQARIWYAQYLMAAGRLDEATEQIRVACEEEPNSVAAQATAGEIFWRAGRDDEAMQAYKKVLELDPAHIPAHNGLGNVFHKKSLLAEASGEYQKALELMGEPGAARLAHAFTYARRDDRGMLINKLDVLLRQKHVPPSQVARLFAHFNEREKALYWLEKGYQEWDTGLLSLKSDGSWDGLREDPRFVALLRRVGLAEN